MTVSPGPLLLGELNTALRGIERKEKDRQKRGERREPVSGATMREEFKVQLVSIIEALSSVLPSPPQPQVPGACSGQS